MKPQTLYCFLLAFVGGFNVMVLEMCAFRVLPTTFGSSVYVTGTLLALIMIALSMGYYTGGAFSTRATSLGYLFASILGGVAYVQVTNVVLASRLLDFTFELFRKQGTPLPAIALTVFVLYFPPMLALSQITPFLIAHFARTANVGGPSVGQTAGQLMALSTVGSILGTLAPTFWLLPTLGVRKTTLVFEGSLALTVIVGLLVFRRPRSAAVAGVLLLAGLCTTGLATETGLAPDQRLVFESESMYGNIKVVSHTDEFGERLTYYPNRTYAHSSVYPASPLTNSSVALDYLTFLTLAPGKRVLVLGTALGAALAMASEIDPKLEITGVELDPAVIDVSRRYLPQLNRANITLVAEDARVFLKESEATYDFVLVDLFAGDFLPPHCVTREFFSLVRGHLAPEGVMFINSNMPELLALEAVGGIERPIQHLESAIFNAGFPQLLRADFAVNGHLTAFRTARPLEERREALRGQARRGDLPVEFRAQVALESFSVSEVPPARAELVAFTDDWVPDAMIHRRDNVEGHLEAAAREGRSAWRSLVEAQRHETALDIARWRFWEVGHVTGRTFRQFMASPGQLRFCREIDEWAGRSDEPVSEIFRYFNRLDIRNCAHAIAALPAAPAGSRLNGFRGLLLAAALTQEGRSAQAWPSLALAIEDQRLTQAR